MQTNSRALPEDFEETEVSHSKEPPPDDAPTKPILSPGLELPKKKKRKVYVLPNTPKNLRNRDTKKE